MLHLVTGQQTPAKGNAGKDCLFAGSNAQKPSGYNDDEGKALVWQQVDDKVVDLMGQYGITPADSVAGRKRQIPQLIDALTTRIEELENQLKEAKETEGQED